VSEEVADRPIARPTRSQFTVRGSRFVGRGAPDGDVDAAEAFLERVRSATGGRATVTSPCLPAV
jgi:putative IMPACT (imprinted ancient) family translation regulator